MGPFLHHCFVELGILIKLWCLAPPYTHDGLGHMALLEFIHCVISNQHLLAIDMVIMVAVINLIF